MDKVLAHLETGPSAANLSDMKLSVKTVVSTFGLTLSGFTIRPPIISRDKIGDTTNNSITPRASAVALFSGYQWV